MTQVILFENIHSSTHDFFKSAGYSDITSYPDVLSQDKLKLVLNKVEIIGIRSQSKLDNQLIKKLSNLIAIGCFCIGTNQVDLNKSMYHGIPVFNAPFSNTRSVAEMVLGEIILLLRRIPEKNNRIHQGYWDKTSIGSYETRGKTLGIVGYGNIGSQVSILSESLGMNVIYYDIETKLPLGNAKPVTSLQKLLERSDVVTLHVPENKSTKNLINSKTLMYMKYGAIIINASRGTVIDIPALYQALKQEYLSGAALDVFPNEPQSQNESLNSLLIGLPNIILTPHIGGSTQESQKNIGREVSEKLIRFIKTGSTKGSVNFPEIPHLEFHGKTRILHIHHNLPGSLGTLTNLLASYDLNIISQSLQTKEKLGYVITDIDKPIRNEVIKSIQALPTTIRCREILNP